MKGALQIREEDNVATLLEDAAGETVEIVGLQQHRQISVRGAIALGHKVAVIAIADGSPIVKYGVEIGEATTAIAPGDWVHLHNCGSKLDARSNTLDVHTGAPRDTPYE
jgi:altronate dehydratase small subunit